MKQLFDFVYCDGVITPSVVFYMVKVGRSSRDQQAKRFIEKSAASVNFLFVRHSKDMADFVEQIAVSIFGRSDKFIVTNWLRRMIVPVTWLATFLRNNPPCLLNSAKILPQATAVKKSLSNP